MQWLARYSDGSELPQYNADGTENTYAAIDRSRLQSFALYYEAAKVIEVHLDPGQRLIYRRRVERPVGSEVQYIVYMVGWQQTVGGQNVQAIAYVFPDGVVEMAGRWRNDHRWFYAVQPVKAEE